MTYISFDSEDFRHLDYYVFFDIGFPKHNGCVNAEHEGPVQSMVGNAIDWFRNEWSSVMRAAQVPSRSIYAQRLSVYL